MSNKSKLRTYNKQNIITMNPTLVKKDGNYINYSLQVD